MKKQFTKVLALGLVALNVWNCKTSDPEPTPYEAGVYVINQGNFSQNNGTISYIPRNSTSASTDIFNIVNNRKLVGNVQDYTEINGKGVILVDNMLSGQDKIEIVESGTFKSLATLTAPDVENPRYVVMAGPNKAYVTCWGATGTYPNFYVNPGYVLVVDLASRTITKKIPVTKGAERIVMYGNKVFVGCVGGDPTLTVINTDTDELQSPGISIGNNPRPVATDANNKLWVISSGTKEMVRVDPTTNVVETRLAIGGTNRSVEAITINNDKTLFYFVNGYYDLASNASKGETYRFSITDSSIPANKPFTARYFTGLGVDPQTGNLYAGVTPSYAQSGYVLRYQSSGAVIDSVKAEVAPSGFFFR